MKNKSKIISTKTKTKIIAYRGTESEYEQLEKKAKEVCMSVSDYLRYSVAKDKIVISHDLEPIVKMLYEMCSIIQSDEIKLDAFGEGVKEVCQSCASLRGKYRSYRI